MEGYTLTEQCVRMLACQRSGQVARCCAGAELDVLMSFADREQRCDDISFQLRASSAAALFATTQQREREHGQ